MVQDQCAMGGDGWWVGTNGAAMGRHFGAFGNPFITCLVCASYSGQTTRCCLPMGKHRSDFKCRSTETTRAIPPPWVHAPPVPNQYTNVKAICVLEPCTLRPPTEAIHKCKGNLCIGAMYPPPPTEAIHKCKGHLCNWLTKQCV